MNVNVDVAKASCNAVEKILSYFNCAKFKTECCNDEAKKAILEYYIATSDCVLSAKVLDSINDSLCHAPSTICKSGFGFIVSQDCEDTITAQVGATAYPCNYNTKYSNPFDGSAFPRLELTPNSIYHKSKINVVTSSTCSLNTTTTPIESGCSSTGCSIERNPYGKTGIVLPGVISAHPTGYLAWLTFYSTDSNGNRPLIPNTVNISPSNIASWTACPTCTSTFTSHLTFNDPLYKEALEELLKNVTDTLFGPGTARWEVAKSASDLYIYSRIKHLPTSTWAGINPDGALISYFNGSFNVDVTPTPRSPNLAAFNPLNSTTAIHAEITHPTDCGEINYFADKYGIFHEQNHALTNIDRIEVSNYNAINSITTPAPTPVCTLTQLTATVITNGAIASLNWYNPSGALFAYGYSVIVSTPGLYTFIATTANGCQAVQTIYVS